MKLSLRFFFGTFGDMKLPSRQKAGLSEEIFTGHGIRLSGDMAVCLEEQIDYRSVRCVSEDP